ncbi:recombination protein NinG [Parabacteroides provencensis]|uniref:recombination protein NinG n=1 Tax=Parabacteroides provencensis TaxID=1944636 RepID=UPI000C15B58E|nr:recombination protein NinG [Parabacteroides provencensis]
MNEAKSKRLTIPILQQRLDRVFSEYIRLQNASENGFCKCITCGSMWRWNLMHNGHYIDRRHIKTRYDTRNCHVQCPNCNIGLRGNLDKYKRFIIDKYGVKVLEELESARRSIEKWTVVDYLEKIKYYKEEVKRIRKEKGL